MKKIVLVILALCILLTSAGCQNGKDTKPQPQNDALPQGAVYENEYDGYRITAIEGGFHVNDLLAEVGTFFESNNTVIEIYKQQLNGLSAESYKHYSNGFLNNDKDHVLDFEFKMQIGENSFNVTAWHRQKLLKVKNDKNYYILYESERDGNMWTFLVKTSDDSQDALKYSKWIETVEYFKPTAKAPIFKTKAKANTKKWNKETADFYNKYFGDDKGLTWGIFEPLASNGDHSKINGYQSALNYKFPIVCTYSGFTDESVQHLEKRLYDNWKNGAVMEFTLQPKYNADGSNMMYNILQGEYDNVIDTYAKTFKEFEHPILLRLMNEMNGEWCPYSCYNTSRDSVIYREVYYYIYSKLQNAGVNNVIWVWNPNESSFPKFKWNDMLMYYPGDKYVDVVGLTAYNTGNYYNDVGERWQDFDTLYSDLYTDYCNRFSMPIMITEFSCAEMGGDKRAWVTDMFNKLNGYERIKVAIWWDHVDLDYDTGDIARDYRIENVLDIFAQNINK